MLRLALLILLSYSFAAYSQDISGKWKGNYGKSFLSASINELVVDIELLDDSTVTGTSHLYYGGDKYEHYVINGHYHSVDSTIYFSEDEEIDVKLGMLASNVMGNYTMKLSVKDTLMRFEGKWKENGSGLMSMMATRVWLEKPIPKKTTIQETTVTTAAEIKDTITPLSKDTITKTNVPPIRILRVIEVDSTEQDSIRIEITDNARIDNDMISLYINDALVIHKQRISNTPLVVKTSVSKNNPQISIRMQAESYGSMPPCTARLSIITPKTSYAVDVESNYSTSGGISIVLKN